MLAVRRGFDPLSPVRQTGRLTRCVTDLNWYARADLNGHWKRSRRFASAIGLRAQNWRTSEVTILLRAD